MIALFYNSEGRITDWVTGPRTAVDANIKERDAVVVEELTAGVDELMVVSGELVQLPPCPSDDHEFDYATKSWKLDAAQVNAALLDGIRRQRDRLLTASDWTQLPGSPLSDEQVAAFQSYRQELRDLPTTYKDAQSLSEVVIPVPPQ